MGVSFLPCFSRLLQLTALPDDGSQMTAPSMDVDGLEEVSRPATPSADASASTKSKKKRRKSTAEGDVDKSIAADGAEDAPKKKKKKKAKKE